MELNAPYTTEDLHIIAAQSHVQVPTGKKVVLRNGKTKNETKGVTVVKTAVGELAKENWANMFEAAINREKMFVLYKAVLQHVSELAWLKEAPLSERRTYALECIDTKAYLAWEKRGEFTIPENNKKNI